MHAYTHTLHDYMESHLEIYSQEMLRIVKKIIDVSIPKNVLLISSQSAEHIYIRIKIMILYLYYNKYL